MSAQFSSGLVQTVGHRRINDLVTEVDERTPEHRRVNNFRQLDRAAGDPF